MTDTPMVAPQEMTTLLWILAGIFAGALLLRLLPYCVRASLAIAVLAAGMLGLFAAAKATGNYLPPKTQAFVWLFVAGCGLVTAFRASRLLTLPEQRVSSPASGGPTD